MKIKLIEMDEFKALPNCRKDVDDSGSIIILRDSGKRLNAILEVDEIEILSSESYLGEFKSGR